MQKTDCMAEWYVDSNTPLTRGPRTRRLDCTPGESCDADGNGQDGICTFRLAVCLNNDDPRLTCVPSDVVGYQLLHPNTASRYADATDVENAAAVLQALSALPGASVNGQLVTFSPTLTAANVCTAPFDVVVPLRQTRKGAWRLGSRSLRVVVSGPAAGRRGAVKDRDSIFLRCHPPMTPTPTP